MKRYYIFTVVLKGFGYLEEYINVEKQLYTTHYYQEDSDDIYRDTGFRIIKII